MIKMSQTSPSPEKKGKKDDKPQGVKEKDPLVEGESNRSWYVSGWFLVALAVSFVAGSLAMHYCRMKKSSNVENSGAYKPVATGGEAEMTDLGDNIDVDAEYGEIEGDDTGFPSQ